MGHLTAIIWLLLLSVLLETPWAQAQTQEERRLKRQMESRIYHQKQDLLRQEPVYRETLEYCRNGGFKNLIKIGWSGTSDMLSASQVMFLDTSGLIRIYQNRFSGSELVYRLSSDAFNRALIDCDPTLSSGKKVIAAYVFSDFLGKSAVVVGVAYAVSLGAIRAVGGLIMRGFQLLPFAAQHVTIGAVAHFTGYNLYYYGSQVGDFWNGRNVNTPEYEAMASRITSDSQNFRMRVLNMHKTKAAEAESALKAEGLSPEQKENLLKELVFRNVSIKNLENP